MIPRAERTTINKEFASIGDFLLEYVTDVSVSGVFIRSKDPLPPGTRVNLKFTVILDELEVLEGIGEVVRVQKNPSGMGVVFRELTPASQRLLETIIAPILPGLKKNGESPAADADPVRRLLERHRRVADKDQPPPLPPAAPKSTK